MRLAFIQTLLFSDILKSSRRRFCSCRFQQTLPGSLQMHTNKFTAQRHVGALPSPCCWALLHQHFPLSSLQSLLSGCFKMSFSTTFLFLALLALPGARLQRVKVEGGAPHPQPLPPSQWLGAFAFSNVFNQIKRIEDMQMPFPKRNTGLNCCWQVTASHHPQQPLS